MQCQSHFYGENKKKNSFQNNFCQKFLASMLNIEGIIYFTIYRNLVTILPLSLDDPSMDHIRLQQLLSGYGLLHSVDLLLPCLPKTKKDVFCQQLFDNVYQVWNHIISPRGVWLDAAKVP